MPVSENRVSDKIWQLQGQIFERDVLTDDNPSFSQRERCRRFFFACNRDAFIDDKDIVLIIGITDLHSAINLNHISVGCIVQRLAKACIIGCNMCSWGLRFRKAVLDTESKSLCHKDEG